MQSALCTDRVSCAVVCNPLCAFHCTPDVQDEDFVGPQGLTYSITSGDSIPPSFVVNATTGAVTVVNFLDFETQALWELNVSATDAGVPPLIGLRGLSYGLCPLYCIQQSASAIGIVSVEYSMHD